MKEIGYTEQGNKIIEMSKGEYDTFARLSQAVEGTTQAWLAFREPRFEQGFDLTKTFGVIHAWYIVKFRLNEFQELLNTMKESLEKESG